jgi:hypothetical protein
MNRSDRFYRFSIYLGLEDKCDARNAGAECTSKYTVGGLIWAIGYLYEACSGIVLT